MSKALFTEVTAPATPESGKVALYAKTDGNLYQKDDAGTETQLGVSSGGTVTSVGLSTDASYLTIGSSPVTSSGTITANKTTGQTANQFVATPDGSTGTADLRAIVAGDVRSLGMVTNAVDYYETTGSADSSWTLSGWSTDTSYTFLVVDLWIRATATATLYVRPNSDSTAANYYGMSSAEYSTATTANGALGTVATMIPGGNYFSASYDHPNYFRIVLTRHNNTSFYKNFIILGGADFTVPYVYHAHGWWESTSAITSLYVAFSTGNLNLGSGYRVQEG